MDNCKYESGELKLAVKTKDCVAYNAEHNDCFCGEIHCDDLDDDEKPFYYLPHQCSEWRIGSRNDLIRMRDDINKLLEQEEDGQ